jgi:hypothetical protein
MSIALSSKNKVVVASAGSGKTTFLVESALAITEKRILITTYTNENVEQIRTELTHRVGLVPSSITVSSWYSLLLQDGVRPYQSCLTDRGRIQSICFQNKPPALRYVKKTDVARYFLTKQDQIYRDTVADFVCTCDDCSEGKVIRRLEGMYDYILIDEMQDLAGYDLVLLEKLFCSSISVVAVGDPRQGTFATNNSVKNRQFKRSHILDWVNCKQGEKLISVEQRNSCYRSNQAICDFADALFPNFPKTISKNNDVTGHDGVFLIKPDQVEQYIHTQKPMVLRYRRTDDTMGVDATNIGVTKGRTYDRVLIFPTGPMKDYLKSQDVVKAGDVAKFYVAVTRARYSVAFVVED